MLPVLLVLIDAGPIDGVGEPDSERHESFVVTPVAFGAGVLDALAAVATQDACTRLKVVRGLGCQWHQDGVTGGPGLERLRYVLCMPSSRCGDPLSMATIGSAAAGSSAHHRGRDHRADRGLALLYLVVWFRRDPAPPAPAAMPDAW